MYKGDYYFETIRNMSLPTNWGDKQKAFKKVAAQLGV